MFHRSMLWHVRLQLEIAVFWEDYSTSSRKMVRKFLKSQDGVAAIEFALIIPVLTLMLLALWDLSNYSNEKMRLQQMLRAMTSNVVSGIDSSAFNSLNDKVIEQFYPDPSEIKPYVVINDGCFCSGSSVGCFSLCSDGSVPSRIATIYASILVSGPLLGDRNAETSLDIQLR